MSNDAEAIVDLLFLREISIFASTKETRYYLNGVCLEIESDAVTYVATDGHRLLAYRRPNEKDANVNTLLGTFIIPTEACRTVKFKKAFTFGVLCREVGSKTLKLQYGDKGAVLTPIDGTFPDWRAVYPIERASGKAGDFNLEYLASFQKFSKAVGYSGIPRVAFNGPSNATRIVFEDPDCIGVIMPIRMGAKDPIASWASHRQPEPMGEAA